MSVEETNEQTSADSSELTRAPGETFWTAGSGEARPLRILQGVVAYRRGNVAIGLLGPGQVALPVPGVAEDGPAAADLVASTETTAVEAMNGTSVNAEELAASALAVVNGADRLGNMSLPQRLAALLLDISELTGQPVVGCRQDILAMAAAARRETVATILSGWRDEDWIQTRYRRCKVLDREALLRIRDKGQASE
jgi:CRP-like cAMP-binding protein